jgi:hypothetical protein
MFRGLGDVMQILGSLLPPWALAGLGVVLAVVAGPAWFDNVRSKQIRGVIRKMLRATTPEKVPLKEQALELAARRPRRLVALVRESHKYDLKELRDAALARLEALGSAPEDVRVLRALVKPPPPPLRDPLQAVVKVERALELGLVVGAREALAEGLRQHPDDPDLHRLRDEVEALSDASGAPRSGEEPRARAIPDGGSG